VSPSHTEDKRNYRSENNSSRYFSPGITEKKLSQYTERREVGPTSSFLSFEVKEELPHREYFFCTIEHHISQDTEAVPSAKLPLTHSTPPEIWKKNQKINFKLNPIQQKQQES
jgi:hypothetical protein